MPICHLYIFYGMKCLLSSLAYSYFYFLFYYLFLLSIFHYYLVPLYAPPLSNQSPHCFSCPRVLFLFAQSISPSPAPLPAYFKSSCLFSYFHVIFILPERIKTKRINV